MENAHFIVRSSLPQIRPKVVILIWRSDHWDERTARAEWAAWTAAKPLSDDMLTIRVNGRGLHDGPSQFDARSREITLDTSPLVLSEHHATPQKTARVKFLLFIKGLHEVVHFMAELILRFFKHLYRNEPYAKRKKIPIKSVPARVGDCGYQLEQFLSGNLRFSFEHEQKSTFLIRRITAISKTGRLGYYVPDELISLVVANPNAFYSSLRNSFADHSQLLPIPADSMKFVYKCGKVWKLDFSFPRGAIKF